MEVNSTDLEQMIKQTVKIVMINYMNELMEMRTNTIGDISLSSNKQLLVLIPEFVVNTQIFLKYLVDKHPGYELVIATLGGSTKYELKEAVEILNINDEKSRDKILTNLSGFYKTYLIMPGTRQLEALVNGDDEAFIEKLMLYLVLQDKAPGIILDYKIKDLPTNILTKKLSGLLKQIEEMKISIDILNNKPLKEHRGNYKPGKILLTENDINELNASGIKTISKEQEYIITPLAKDRMRELGIIIV
jgi:hypothetical protein